MSRSILQPDGPITWLTRLGPVSPFGFGSKIPSHRPGPSFLTGFWPWSHAHAPSQCSKCSLKHIKISSRKILYPGHSSQRVLRLAQEESAGFWLGPDMFNWQQDVMGLDVTWDGWSLIGGFSLFSPTAKPSKIFEAVGDNTWVYFFLPFFHDRFFFFFLILD